MTKYGQFDTHFTAESIIKMYLTLVRLGYIKYFNGEPNEDIPNSEVTSVSSNMKNNSVIIRMVNRMNMYSSTVVDEKGEYPRKVTLSTTDIRDEID